MAINAVLRVAARAERLNLPLGGESVLPAAAESLKSIMPAKPVTRAKKTASAKKATPAQKPAAKSGMKAAALPEWNLADLYTGMDAPEVARDLKRLARDCVAFEEAYKGKLAAETTKPGGGAWLAKAVQDYEAIDDLAGRLISYAGLVHAGNQADPHIAKFYGDVQEKLTASSVHLLFFALELNRVDDAVLEGALRDSTLSHYRPWIEDVRKEKPYQLEDRVEQLFHEKSISGYAAWNRLFDETISSLRFRIGAKDLAIEPALNMLQDKDGAKRKAAAKALAKTFNANLRTFTLITNTLAKDKEISDRWRGFQDVADSRHLANRVEREVVDALVDAVRAAYPDLSHRYYALKARWFGKKTLNYWDRNAPLPFAAKRNIPWIDAREMVLSAYSAFSPDMAKIAARFFDDKWIDAPVRPGKSPGAFSHPTVPSAHPYVMMNYQGKPRDVMTLAHELGHGVHQVLAAGQGELLSSTPLTLAETASVFGEMLTFRKLLEKAKTKAERKTLLAGKVEDMINTVVRQIAFYDFECKLHAARAEGELTPDDINALWMSVQAQSLGDVFDFMDGYETFWAYIPHFVHSPFYVYAYAFGDGLVNALYAAYEDGLPDFQEKYFQMLKAGGSMHHKDLLAPFGLDASDPKFWDKGLSMIAGFIDELEAMED